MGILILESKFDTENGEVVERNFHDGIRKEIFRYSPASVIHIESIDNEIAYLKQKGFDIIYSLKIDPQRTKELNGIV